MKYGMIYEPFRTIQYKFLSLKCTKYLKTYRTMDNKNLTDYYPVYKDVSEFMKNMPAGQYFEYPICGTKLSSEQSIHESEYAGSPAILNGEVLTDLAFKCGLSTFQTVILLIKNSFEEHVFLKYNVRPDQLFRQGTSLYQTKPEIMILNFYENFYQYKPRLNQIWMILQEREPDLAVIDFELLVQSLIVNHLIRFPVSLFSFADIRSYTDQMLMNQQAMQQRFDLVLLGEQAIGEFEFIEMVNIIYADKYREFVHQLRIKDDILSHYQRKLILALCPDIHTEKELDDLMYRKLLEEKMSRTPNTILRISPDGHPASEILIGKLKIREKIKILYRTVSKYCSEVHSAPDSEHSLPELTQIFLNANSIYIQPLGNIAEALLQYMRMILLLSRIVIFRKTHELEIAVDLQLLSNISLKEVLSKDDLKSVKRELDTGLVEYRMKSLTDYKMKFIMDDDLTDIHNHFLQKHMDFIDEQIILVQSDIREVLKMKSEGSMLKTSKN